MTTKSRSSRNSDMPTLLKSEMLTVLVILKYVLRGGYILTKNIAVHGEIFMVRALANLVVFLATVLLASSMFSQQSAIARFGKGATIKGIDSAPVVPEILPGQIVHVPPGSYVLIYRTYPSYDKVEVGENTEAAYLSDSIELIYGTTRISTTDRLSAQVHGDMVIPKAPKKTTYQVSWLRDTGIAVVYEGQVEISKCKKKYVVPVNHVAEFRKNGCEVGVYEKDGWTMGRGVAFGSAAVAAPALCTTFDCANALMPELPVESAEKP